MERCRRRVAFRVASDISKSFNDDCARLSLGALATRRASFPTASQDTRSASASMLKRCARDSWALAKASEFRRSASLDLRGRCPM